MSKPKRQPLCLRICRDVLGAMAACLAGKRGELMQALALHDVRWVDQGQPFGVAGSPVVGLLVMASQATTELLPCTLS